MRTLILVLTASFLFTSCSFNPWITGYSDPAFINKKYSHIAVFFEYDNFSKRDFIEKAISKEINESTLSTCTPGSLLFPPTRNWKPQDVNNRLSTGNFDGKLIISIKNTEKKVRITPAKTVTRVRKVETTEESTSDDNSRTKNSEDQDKTETSEEVTTIVTDHIPEKVSERYYSIIDIVLVDIQSNQVAYRASLTLNGVTEFDYEDARKLALNIVHDFKEKNHAITR